MPTYEYQCDACGYRFERFQSITARSIRKCPECGKQKVQRLISAGAGFIFKGSGFYETDYRSEQYKKDAKADSEASKKSAESSKKKDSSSDSKSDSKKKSKKKD